VSAARARAAKAGPEPAVGIIGGSGLYEMEGIEDLRWVRVRTPFGDPSDAYCTGRLGDRRVIFLPRHGRGHRIMPTDINYRANLYGLKALGARWVISVSAVGSMKEEIHPLDLVVPDQFYDHTRRRVSTFFGEGIVGHVGLADPVCPTLGDLLEAGSREAGARVHRGGTYICSEGPQFSTKGESQIYRRWGVSVIGMTNMPEAKLAREAELCYATLALATDYDVWHESHAAVTVEAVVANLFKNVATAKVVLRRVIPRMGKAPCGAGCGDALASAVITDPRAFPPRTRRKLALLLDRYFPPKTGGRRGG
jgi:5'-methylthioadenosine phosphorylase